MIQAKQALLAALADSLQEIAPGSNAPAAFESPKQAAHGDFACTAAMQLAKPLKANPRELATRLIAALEAKPAFQTWVQSLEIAGPGFINIRLKPAAKQAVVAEVLTAGEKFGHPPAST
jgi:arginyl-tRNA synthetase